MTITSLTKYRTAYRYLKISHKIVNVKQNTYFAVYTKYAKNLWLCHENYMKFQ